MMKKLLYTLVIVSMLVAAFGARGVGVQTAAAAAGWNDDGTAVNDTGLPYYFGTLNMTTAQVSAGGNQGGCSAVAVFGAYQSHLLDDVTPATPAGFYRVRVEAADIGSYQWAVLVRNAATNVEIGCAIAVGGVVDLTVPVGVGVDVVITVTNIGFFVPTDTTYETYIARFENGGGLIVDMNGDTGNTANRLVAATSTVDDTLYYGGWNGWVAFLDVPDGTFNLGITDTTMDAEFATYYPGVTAPGLVALTPDQDAVIPLTVQFLDITGVAQDIAVYITPNDGGLVEDLWLGNTQVGAEAVGEKTFEVNPGYLWDIALVHDGITTNYFLVSLAFNPTLGTLMFDASTTATWVLPEVDRDYDIDGVELDPPGALEARLLDIHETVGVPCAPGYACENVVLSADIAYEVTDLWLFEAGWQYGFLPTITIWDFAAVDFADPAAVPAYNPILGDTPWVTTPFPGTSAGLYTLPLAAGEVALERGPWTDQFGNEIVYVIDTNPVVPVEYAPEYEITTVAGPWVPLANDWDTTDLGPITDVGRYDYWRGLYHGPLAGIDGPQGYFSDDTIFAIQPADMSMMTDWSWSWVMAMYEYDLTNGLNGGGYAPNAPVTRAQMAAFLSRVLDLFLVAPTGAAPAFSDVPAAYWAAAEIAHLRDYGITTGTNWCNGVAVTNSFCPNANVTRAEMTKFIEVTFRTIKTFAGVDFYWPEEQNIYIHGITFMDVPVDYWANVWIEEFFFDQLTDGCMRDGLNLYYCPGDEVTRGQMAKFIIRAIQPDFVTQGFWPILAPSK